MQINLLLISNDNNLKNEIGTRIKKINHFKTISNIPKDDYNIIIYDIRDIDVDNLQYYLSKLNKVYYEIPVIIVLGNNDIEKIENNMYFDDFIVLPLNIEELKKRIQLLLPEKKEEYIQYGNVKLYLNQFEVYVAGNKVQLTYKEFELLRLLLENKGKVFSRKELLASIWGIDYIGGTRTVDVHIRRLRSKLGSEFKNIIDTVRNVGYRCK